jgi:hypothetical protein
MVPGLFEHFFMAMSEGGAALLGLLFVAVSIRRTSNAEQPAEAAVLGDATLFALADGFVISAAALHPAVRVAYVALVMSVVGYVWAARGLIHLNRAWARNRSRDLQRWRFRLIGPNLIGLLVNGTQVVAAVRLVFDPTDNTAVGLLASVVLAYYLIALLRAWVIVGGAHFGPRAAFSDGHTTSATLLRQRHLPPWPQVRHGPKGPSPMSRPPLRA